MKILVMGGSYFLGKAFVEQVGKEHEIWVFNRGSRRLTKEHVTQLTGDRQENGSLTALEAIDFDVVVDFCAYRQKDIENCMAHLQKSVKQYIFISTVDVLAHRTGQLLEIDSDYESIHYGGEIGAYIDGKIALEKELMTCCEEKTISYTIIRPAILYGPGNYAPRESLYFHWLKEANQFLHPQDATGYFQYVYVEDAAKIIVNCLNNKAAENQIFHVCGGEAVTYERFADALLKSWPKQAERIDVSVAMVMERNIPLPFPLVKEESEVYADSFVDVAGFCYTALEEGLRKTIENLDRV